MYVLSRKSVILTLILHCRILTIFSHIVEKAVGFKISFDVQYFQLSYFRPVEPLYKRSATFKLYVLPLSQF